MTTVRRCHAAATAAGAWLVVLTMPAMLSGAGQEVLTFSQAVKEALLHNDRLVDEADNIEQANLSVELARSAFRPKIVPNIQGSFGQTDVNNQNYRLDLTQRFSTGTEVRAGIGTSTAQIPGIAGQGDGEDIRFYNTDTTIMVSQPLLRGAGSAIAKRSLLSAELRQEEAVRARTLNEQIVTVEVASAYYRLVAQKAFVQVAEKSLERARKLLEAAEAKLASGMVSQLDVFRAKNLLSQAEIQFFDAQGSVEEAHDQLCLLIGRSPALPLEVSADIPRTVDPLPAADAVALALSRRLDLQSAVAGLADTERAMAYARNQLLPQFDLSLSMTRRKTAPSFGKSFGFNQFQLAPFFSIAMPVDRTPQQIEYQNAIIDRDRRTRQVDTLRDRIADDVRRALRSRERAVRILASAEEGVEISRQEVLVAQLRYDRGLSNNLDVVAAEAGLLSAESRRLSVLAELAVANLRVRATVGTLDPRADIVDAAPAGR
jgi:outer membrane protein